MSQGTLGQIVSLPRPEGMVKCEVIGMEKMFSQAEEMADAERSVHCWKPVVFREG